MWKIFVALLVGCGGIFYFDALLEMGNFPASTDFFKFYYSAGKWFDGNPVYWGLGDPQYLGEACEDEFGGESFDQCLHPNLNPPFFILMTLPFHFFEFDLAWLVWSFLSLVFCCVSLYVYWGSVFEGVKRDFLVIASLFSFPLFLSLQIGQVTSFLMVLLVLSWLSIKKGRFGWAGLCFGLAISSKPFLLLLLPFCVIAGWWRTLGIALVVCAVAAFLGAVVIGFDSYLMYFQLAGLVDWFDVNWNASFAGFFHSAAYLLGFDGGWVNYFSLAAGLLVLALSLWVVWINRFESLGKVCDLVFALAIPTCLLLSPLGWVYYFPLLMFSYGYVLGISRRDVRLFFWLSGLIFLVPTVLKDVEHSDLMWSWMLYGSMYFYVLLGLWCMMITIALAAHRRRILKMWLKARSNMSVWLLVGRNRRSA